jgi:membrane AbrB-like protein
MFDLVKLPAALMLGPMVGGIIFGTRGTGLKVPRLLTLGAQSVIGALIARGVSPEIVTTFVHDWPIALAALLSNVIAGNILGMAMMKLGTLPGTTAIWGCSPGGAFAMMIMAEAYGDDPRLVAFMQYTRVVAVAVVASIVARIWLGNAAQPHAVVWFPAINWIPFLETLALSFGGAALGTICRIPAGAILVPFIGGSILRALGLIEIALPPWFLAISFFFAAWSVGLSFTRPILMHALRAMPQIVVSMLLLIAFSGGIGVLLARATGTDLLSAYLATSPGGLDSVAIIAAQTNVDVSLVMTLQTMRLFVAIVFGPITAKTAIRIVGGHPRPPEKTNAPDPDDAEEIEGET